MTFFEDFYRIIIQNQWYELLLRGLLNTLLITLCSLILGLIIGILVAIVKVLPSKSFSVKVLKFFSNIYLAIFRGTPVMVQLLLIYFVLLAPLQVPKFLVAVIVFGLNSGAYTAEAIRGGILAVEKGQTEAGRSLGMSYKATMFKIILPQAIKNILPALGNEFIALLKETSVAGVISVEELTRASDLIKGNTANALVAFISAAILYLIIVLVVTALLKLLEERLRKSDKR